MGREEGREEGRKWPFVIMISWMYPGIPGS